MAQEAMENKKWAKPFFTMWFGQVFSILGSRLVSFALVWWLTEKTGSATVLATSTIMIYLPQIFLGPFVGALVDRWNRRLVLIIVDGAVALATLVLALLFWLDVIEIWHIYVLVFLRSLGGCFHFPAMQASISMMVPDKHLSRIAGINQILDGGVSIAGPALGALLMGLIPVQGVLAVDVVTAVIAIVPLFFIVIPQPKNGKPKVKITPKVVLDDVVEGFRFVSKWRGMMILLSVAIFLNFIFAPTGSFIPLLVTEHFKGDVMQLGLLESIMGVGMIGGGLLLSIWGGFRKRVYNMLIGMMVMGGSCFLVGVAPENGLYLAATAFFVEGIANTMMNGSVFALMQSVIPADMQGRVFSMLGSATSALSPLGLLLAAPIVEIFGIQSWYMVAGVLTVVISLLVMFIPAVIHIEDFRGKADEAVQETPTALIQVGDK